MVARNVRSERARLTFGVLHPAPNALDVLKKFGKSLFRRNKKPKHVEQPAAPEPEVEETNEAEPPAPYGVPPPPQTPPAPKVSEHAPQIEAPTGMSHLVE